MYIYTMKFIYQAFPPSTWVRGGGEDRNAQEKCQVQDALETFLRFLWLFPKCLWPGETNIKIRKGRRYLPFLFLWSWVKNAFQGWFIEGLEAPKKWVSTAFFCNVLLHWTEKLLFWYKTCKMWLDCEKPIENAIGVDFVSSCFLPKLGFTSQFTWFCAFFIKSLFCFEADLQQDKLQYFWEKKSPKMPP